MIIILICFLNSVITEIRQVIINFKKKNIIKKIYKFYVIYWAVRAR